MKQRGEVYTLEWFNTIADEEEDMFRQVYREGIDDVVAMEFGEHGPGTAMDFFLRALTV